MKKSIRLLTAKDLAARLSFSEAELQEMIKDNIIPAGAVVMIGGKTLRFKRDVIFNWVESCTLKSEDIGEVG